MKKNIILLSISFLFYACISYDLKQVDCASIEKIEIINRTSDQSIPRSISITKTESVNEFCNLINSRKFAGSIETKRNLGFFYITIKMKDGGDHKFDVINTLDYGIVIRYGWRYYREEHINDYIYSEFKKQMK